MYHRYKGFTLIEVLLALFITAILTTILSVVFNTGLRSYRQGKDLLEITRKAQLILGQMSRELVGAMVGPYITFRGESNAIYFMAPVENSSKLDLCEIGYLLNKNEKKLIRHFVTYAQNSSPFEYPDNPVDYDTYGERGRMIFCEGVTGFDLKYNGGGGWGDNPWGESDKLPEMVEVSVVIQGQYPKDKPQERTFTTWVYLPNSTNNP